MKVRQYNLEKVTSWQQIFLQSKVNGGTYYGEQLFGLKWNWPINTYLQRRLDYLRTNRFSSKIAELSRPAATVSYDTECEKLKSNYDFKK